MRCLLSQLAMLTECHVRISHRKCHTSALSFSDLRRQENLKCLPTNRYTSEGCVFLKNVVARSRAIHCALRKFYFVDMFCFLPIFHPIFFVNLKNAGVPERPMLAHTFPLWRGDLTTAVLNGLFR